MLTLVFKILLFPVTYKNYISSAKMKVIKPEVDALNEKFKDKDAVQKQQAMMDLYRKTGVNPLAGCLPLLLQMPILFALFRFFPALYRTQAEEFLWAEDLSTYDSVLDLSFAIPFYGDHVSLFAILMAISTLFYSLMNMQISTMSGPQAAQMKIMMYLMPFMMLFFFNSTSSGLSYYYFAANMISIGQQWIIKQFFVNEKAILAKIEANKVKAAANPNKKSSFQKRLEDMAKARGYKGKV
jgi:YidC/Oxa1 family membrane protein insertase